jgi:D-xylose transport system substrate-binding protein
MKSKLFICVLLLLAGFMAIQSCGPRKKTPVIGLMMDQFNVERWAMDTTYFIKAVKQLNGKVICMVANGDAAKQLEQAKTLISKDVDVFVIVPVDLNKAAEIVKIAKDASKGVISYDRLIQNSFIDYYISFDNAKVGELQADYICKRMGKGNIAIIGGPASDQNSNYLKYGQLGVLQPYIEKGDIKIVYNKMVNAWSFDEGYRAGVECLRNNKVDAIIAGNDLLARGAIKALQEKGLAGKVLVAGQDADTQACQNIIAGYQTMSVYKSIEDLATNAAKMAVDLARGKPIENASYTINNGLKMVPSILLNPILVNKGNIGMQVQVKPEQKP